MRVAFANDVAVKTFVAALVVIFFDPLGQVLGCRIKDLNQLYDLVEDIETPISIHSILPKRFDMANGRLLNGLDSEGVAVLLSWMTADGSQVQPGGCFGESLLATEE